MTSSSNFELFNYMVERLRIVFHYTAGLALACSTLST